MMENGESIADFLSRAVAIVNKIRSCGEKVTDQTIVEKIPRSLTPKFDHVVAAIEESKDLSVFSFDELMGSLQAHEARLNRSIEKNEDKAFLSRKQQPNMVRTMVQHAEVEEEENFVVVVVMGMEEVEEGMVGIGSPMSKVTQRMAFNVIIICATGI